MDLRRRVGYDGAAVVGIPSDARPSQRRHGPSSPAAPRKPLSLDVLSRTQSPGGGRRGYVASTDEDLAELLDALPSAADEASPADRAEADAYAAQWLREAVVREAGGVANGSEVSLPPVDRLRAYFDAHDESGSGQWGPSELRRVVRGVGLDLRNDELARLAHRIGGARGEIDLRDLARFLAAGPEPALASKMMKTGPGGDLKAAVTQAFDMAGPAAAGALWGTLDRIDAREGNTGTVPRRFFERALEHAGIEMSDRALSDSCDLHDVDGRIDVAQYRRWCGSDAADADADAGDAGDGGDGDEEAAEVMATLRHMVREAALDGVSMSEAFAHFDADGSGEIDGREFVRGMASLGVRLGPSEAAAVVMAFKAKGGGGRSIDYVSFVEALDPRRPRKAGAGAAGARGRKGGDDPKHATAADDRLAAKLKASLARLKRSAGRKGKPLAAALAAKAKGGGGGARGGAARNRDGGLELSARDFRAALVAHGLKLTASEMAQLLKRFGASAGGAVDAAAFLESVGEAAPGAGAGAGGRRRGGPAAAAAASSTAARGGRGAAASRRPGGARASAPAKHKVHKGAALARELRDELRRLGRGSGRRGAAGPREHAIRIFEGVDVDGTGAVDMKEFASVLRRLGLTAKRDEVVALLRLLGLDHEGVVEYDEFVDLIVAYEDGDDEDDEADGDEDDLYGGSDRRGRRPPAASARTARGRRRAYEDEEDEDDVYGGGGGGGGRHGRRTAAASPRSRRAAPATSPRSRRAASGYGHGYDDEPEPDPRGGAPTGVLDVVHERLEAYAKRHENKTWTHLFFEIDKDRSGTISEAELGTILVKIGFDVEDAVTVLGMLDTDESGEVDYKEFIRGMKRSTPGGGTPTPGRRPAYGRRTADDDLSPRSAHRRRARGGGGGGASYVPTSPARRAALAAAAEAEMMPRSPEIVRGAAYLTVGPDGAWHLGRSERPPARAALAAWEWDTADGDIDGDGPGGVVGGTWTRIPVEADRQRHQQMGPGAESMELELPSGF